MDERVKQFIKLYNIKLDKWGRLILYKAVTSDFNPWSSSHDAIFRWEKEMVQALGKKKPYKPGTLVRCSRYDTNIKVSCSSGLHAGTFSCATAFCTSYLSKGTAQIIEVRVRPEDVVCVPQQALHQWVPSESQKIRCRALYVEKVVPRKEYQE